MKYRVRHVTSYKYADPVDLAGHILHLLPRALPHQHVLSSQLTALPVPTYTRTGVDHFGNRLSWLFVEQPHSKFQVMSEALVDVAFPPAPDPTQTPPWEVVARQAQDWPAAEFVFDSPMVRANDAALQYARLSFAAERPVLDGLRHLSARIRRDFKFRAGVTTIATPITKVLQQRAGVCQDFTHLMIAGLRGLGLPARYVSGYLRTRPPPGGAARRGADQSHAWVGCWLGREHGWIDLDPTNDLLVHDEHVVLGWGRDFGDVSPAFGIILGGRKHALSVGVDLEAV